MSRKGENIHKRKDGRWEGRYKKGYTDSGKLIYGSVYAKSYREAKEKLHLAINMQNTPEATNKTSILLFSDAVEQWSNYNAMKLKGGTKKKYSYLIETHILPELGAIALKDISAPMINSFLQKKLEHGRLDGKGGLSPSYVRSISLIISSVLKYATTEELCSPLKSSICKPNLNRKDLVILSLDDQKRLESHIENELSGTNVGIMISLYTGLRIGEICALNWSDINIDAKTIFVRHTISRVNIDDPSQRKSALILDEPKTPSSHRNVPIPSPLLEVIKRYQAISNSQFVVSETSTFTSPRTFEYRYHKVLSLCNIEQLNFHALRHTFATRCVEAGIDIKTISEILGHSNASITLNTYVHSSIEMKKSQLEKLALMLC